ncbi:MAG TPA: aldehyde dehydrogenase family protein [Steroidobacter sp.]|uniref:aldehyde dehydrogenase family protein n=1 Tax=Steroidobacter sp. TaxID=1978227 RepID=UPI002EDA0343
MNFMLTIDGQPVSTGAMLDVINPADETIVAKCPQGNREIVDAAVAAARRAFPQWSAAPDAERVAKLLEIADLIQNHSKELAELITLEQGKPQSGPGANQELKGAAAWTRATASLTLPEQIIQDDAAGKILVRRKPVGVVGSITPWNWPLLIAVWHIMPALRVGCTVVIKPSPFTPLSTLRLIELMSKVLPPGVINAVTGGPEVGAHLTTHPNVDKIVFTGSITTGKQIMRGGAATLKRMTLELGGNDAGIILPGTRIEPLLEKLFWSCFVNAGQTCAALKRLYVHADQYEEVVRNFADYCATIPVGNGMDPKHLIGPLTNRMQFEKVAGYVEDAQARGARIVLGGRKPPGPGFFYPLTIIADATHDMLVVTEEQFGPALPIVKYTTVDEAIAYANALEVGLGGSVWGNDPQVAAELAGRLECGTAWVNQHGALHPLAPFGGVKCSGIGVEFGVDGLKEYTTAQVISIAR